MVYSTINHVIIYYLIINYLIDEIFDIEFSIIWYFQGTYITANIRLYKYQHIEFENFTTSYGWPGSHPVSNFSVRYGGLVGVNSKRPPGSKTIHHDIGFQGKYTKPKGKREMIFTYLVAKIIQYVNIGLFISNALYWRWIKATIYISSNLLPETGYSKCPT